MKAKMDKVVEAENITLTALDTGDYLGSVVQN